MNRGDIVIVREARTPAAKARPCVIVQRQTALPAAAKITVCPLTTHLRGTPGQRPLVVPSAENRLKAPSEIEVDWIYTHEIERIGSTIGTVDEATMRQVDEALRRWLSL